MKTNTNDKQEMNERMIIQYLLGSLSGSEVEQLDRLIMTDKDFAVQLDAVENDLVDSYVRGELSQKERIQFQTHYLRSPRRREKVNFAKAFVGRIDLAVKQNEDLIRVPHARLFSSSGAFRWGLTIAAVLVFFTSGFLLLQNMRLRSQITDLQKEQSVLKQKEKEQQLSGQRSVTSEKEKEIKRLEQELAMKEQQHAKLFAFNLEPSIRGIYAPPEFALPMDAETVTWTLILEPNHSVAYLATLKDPVSGKELWHSDRLSGEESIRFNIPAGFFRTQNYLIELFGISERGAKEMIATYPFRILRR